MKYEVRYTTQFKKDLKLAKKQGKNIDRLFDVVEKLANGEALEAKFRDHDLTGNYVGCRECHVEPDWLLVYEVVEDVLVLMLYRVGSHSELFRWKRQHLRKNRRCCLLGMFQPVCLFLFLCPAAELALGSGIGLLSLPP